MLISQVIVLKKQSAFLPDFNKWSLFNLLRKIVDQLL